jgi:hypothetical protein
MAWKLLEAEAENVVLVLLDFLKEVVQGLLGALLFLPLGLLLLVPLRSSVLVEKFQPPPQVVFEEELRARSEATSGRCVVNIVTLAAA